MKTLTGIITSAKNQNTVTVLTERLWEHPIYQKKIKRSKKYLAHTEDKLKEGQKVKIAETKKISKNKNWKVIEILEK